MNKSESMRILAKNLLACRLACRITQEDLAERAGISPSFYANIERGNKGMSVHVLKNLADALGVSVDQLLSDTPDEGRMGNIKALLKDEPPQFILFIEKMIRLCKSELGQDGAESM